MKPKLFLSCALAAACGTASAQSQVTIYGIVDTGIEYVTNANPAGGSMLRMPSLTGSFPSRFGFRGAEDLGGGLSALFVLESGFAMDGGTLAQGGRLFGRQAYVGLKSSYGSLTLGRQSNMTFYSLLKSDVMGPSIHAVTNMDTYLPNARSDNSIAYMGKFANMTVGASYSLGRDASPAGAAGPSATNCAGEVAADARACRQFTALLGYDNAAYGVTASYDVQHGNLGATNGLTSSAHKDARVAFSGYAMVGAAKIGGGLLQRRTRALAATDSDLYFIGASVPFAVQWVLDTQYAQLNVKGTSNKSALATARLSYLLSKRTALYTSLGHIRNRGAAALPVDAGGTVGKGINQAGLMAGIRHTF
jgi:predicted porin